jgi:anion-transporting  ArsA/GET3 family ATPase
MEDGFRERAERVQALLASAGTGFVLVTSPRPGTVAEASYFTERLVERGLDVRALVVNRAQPTFGALGAGEAPGGGGTRDGAETRGSAVVGGPGVPPALAALEGNLADFRAVGRRDDETLRDLTARVAPAPVVRVPLLDDDVHDLDGLARLRPHLVEGP